MLNTVADSWNSIPQGYSPKTYINIYISTIKFRRLINYYYYSTTINYYYDMQLITISDNCPIGQSDSDITFFEIMFMTFVVLHTRDKEYR